MFGSEKKADRQTFENLFIVKDLNSKHQLSPYIVKPELSGHFRKNRYCLFTKGAHLKKVLIPRHLTRYDLKENNYIVYLNEVCCVGRVEIQIEI